MDRVFSKMNIEEFLSQLSSKQPIPGGGGASALAGAVAASLVSMVVNLTTGKKKFAAFEEDLRRILRDATDIRDRLVELIQADADAFYPLSRAYGMSKDDENREHVLQECLRQAVRPPMDMMRQIHRAVDLLDELLGKSSRIVLSDVGVAAAMCYSAVCGASLNVFINTALIDDAKLAHSLNSEANAILKECGEKSIAIFDKVKDKLNNG